MLPAPLILAIEDTLRFEYIDGAETAMGYPYSTGWRTLPFSLTAQAVAGKVDVLLDNGQTLEIGDGEAFYINSGVRHTADKVTLSPSFSRWSHFNLYIFGLVDLNSVLSLPRRFTGSAAHRIGAINVELAELRGDHPLSLAERLKERALGLSLASILIEKAEPRSDTHTTLADFQRLAPVLAYIKTNLSDSTLSRDRLAVLACLSPSRFFAVFKGALGIGPSDYIRSLRLQKAQRLLIGSDYSVQEIAMQAGYPDPFHFSRLFKRHFGVSPIHYRNVVRSSLRP